MRRYSIAKKLNSVPKYVVSTTLNKVEWNNSTLIKGNIVEEVAKLKQQPGSGTLSVTGSGKLAQTLMQHQLIDEYNLLVYPLILGSGMRFLNDGMDTTGLKLVESRTFSSGVVLLRYQPPKGEE